MKKCTDTHKMGIYFGNNILLSLAIMLEEDNLSEIGIFKLNKDIHIAKDKFSYRFLNYSKYHDENGNLKLGIKPSEDENISHFMCDYNPLKMKQSDPELEKIYKKGMSLLKKK